MEPTIQTHAVACTLDPIDRYFTLNFAYFPIPQKNYLITSKEVICDYRQPDDGDHCG